MSDFGTWSKCSLQIKKFQQKNLNIFVFSELFIGFLLLGLIGPAMANPCAGNVGVVFVPAVNCDQYYTCVNDEAFPQTCPDGFYFDEGRQMCYFADQVDCGGEATNPCEGQPQWSFVPRPQDGCGAYYRCDDGVGVPLDCPDGLYFDVANQKCNFPELVDCDGDGGGGPGDPPTAPTPVPTTPEPTTPPPPDPCQGLPNGWLIPNPPAGCAGFLRCENGVGQAERCQDPFYFDFPNQMCNWSILVPCTSSSITA
jgi:Chitin binding Peritrophin-A domain